MLKAEMQLNSVDQGYYWVMHRSEIDNESYQVLSIAFVDFRNQNRPTLQEPPPDGKLFLLVPGDTKWFPVEEFIIFGPPLKPPFPSDSPRHEL